MNDFEQEFHPVEDAAPELAPQPAPKKQDRVMTILMVVFAGIFLLSVGMIGKKLWEAHTQKENFKDLQQIAGTVQKPEQPEVDDAAKAEAERLAGLQALHDQNPDFAGWLQIPDTNINYPVMCTPDDVEYYLYRDFDGNKAVSGVPFLGGGCTSFSSSVIVHGHNMRNGTMFHDLMKYMKQDFWEAHPVITYSTLEKYGQYEVLAAFNYDATLNPDPAAFNLYAYAGDLSEEDFNTLMDYITRHDLYDTGVTAEYGDRLLILSTCAYHTENGRFVVVGREKAEDLPGAQ